MWPINRKSKPVWQSELTEPVEQTKQTQLAEQSASRAN
jgi:hypothetical protein